MVYRFDDGKPAQVKSAEEIGKEKLAQLEAKVAAPRAAAAGQIKYILEHATPNQLVKLRAEFGENLERMPYTRAEKAVTHYQGAGA